MSLQTTVNEKQTPGVAGEFYDDSPRRVVPMIVTAGTPIVAVAASGVITLTDVPTAADTISIGGYTYTFKSTLAAAFDVKIGATADATAKSLTKAINASGTAGVDYFAGTTANLSVEAADTDTGEVTVTAIYGGTVGNTVVFTESADNLTIDPTTGVLAGGVDAYANTATVGRAFSIDTSQKDLAVAGGTGIFAGILVNPKTQTHTGLDATLVVENGKVGEMCTMGHLWIKPANSAVVGYSAYRDNTTGEIYAYTGTGSQSGKTLIPNSQFIIVDYTSPTGLAVLSLTNP